MQSGPQFYALSSVILDRIESELTALQRDTQARCAFVLDRTGCILSSCGDFYPVNPEAMGAIAAAAIAALNSLVARAGTREMSIRFYEGDIERIHFALISDRLILALLHSHKPKTSALRAATRAFAQKIQGVLHNDHGNPESIKSVERVEEKLDELFQRLRES